MAIWDVLIKPILPWLWRLGVAVAATLVVAYLTGDLLIGRAEPDGPATDVPGRFLEVDGQRVHAIDRGSGSPVVLVHGFAGSTQDWDPVIPRLAQEHRVIAIDLLGMGFSARDDALPYGYGLWSEQVIGVMDALGIARAAVVGHSLGGAVAAIVAGEHAGRVERLGLVAPLVPLEPSERAWFFRLLEVPGIGEWMLGTTDHLPNLPGFDAAYHEYARRQYRIRGTRQALLRYLRHGRDTKRLVAAYRGITAPTLVVQGTADDSIPLTAVRRWAPAIHEAMVRPLDGTGHWIMRDAPDELAGALLPFLHGE